MSFVAPKENNDVRRDKLWYLLTSHGEEGPFDPMGLLHHPEFTPDIWCRHLRDSYWRPIRDIPELSFLLKDKRWVPGTDEEAQEQEPETEEIAPPPEEPLSSKLPGEELTLPLQRGPSPIIWIILLIVAALLFLVYQFNK